MNQRVEYKPFYLTCCSEACGVRDIDDEENVMFDYKKHFDIFCKENSLELYLSFDMPAGYETANGTFDFETKTVYVNAEPLSEAPDYEQAFFFFHEMRHALQYLCPELFSDAIIRSLLYTLMFDGTCYKLVDGKYLECKLDGGEDYFTDIYIGQPYEVDANKYAYEQAKTLYGDSEELKKLYEFWIPSKPVPDELYDSIFAEIDEKTKHK